MITQYYKDYTTHFPPLAPHYDFQTFTPHVKTVIPLDKRRSFDDLFHSFSTPRIRNLPQFLHSQKWIQADVRTELHKHFRQIHSLRAASTAQKITEYVSILFNILFHIPSMRRQEPLNYAMHQVLELFNGSCFFYQIQGMQSVIIDTISESPSLLNCSRIDFAFAICLQRYQKMLIAEEIQKAAPEYLQEVLQKNDTFSLTIKGLETLILKPQFLQEVKEKLPGLLITFPCTLDNLLEGIGTHLQKKEAWEEGFAYINNAFGERARQTELDHLGADIRKESIEMEFILMKKLGFSKGTITAHFYENTPIAERIASAVRARYAPETDLVNQLTERYVHESLRSFHALIGLWYRSQGVDPYTPSGRPLLIHPDATDHELWFTSKAIAYFMEKTGLFV